MVRVHGQKNIPKNEILKKMLDTTVHKIKRHGRQEHQGRDPSGRAIQGGCRDAGADGQSHQTPRGRDVPTLFSRGVLSR